MRKIILTLLFLIVAAFIVSQFFQPAKNDSEMGSNHILKQAQVPTEVAGILKHACLDCHSNQTNYLWYHRVAPVSWFINEHIVEGKTELNLSTWGTMEILDKIAALEDMGKEVKNGKMPIKSYQIMHPKARLSKEETDALIAWTSSFSEKLLTGE